jgi:hypothetical protein
MIKLAILLYIYSPAPDARGCEWTEFLLHFGNSTAWQSCGVSLHSVDVRLPLNNEAIIAAQGQGRINDVAQLADKSAAVSPPPYIPRVSSSSLQISDLTARTEELDV